MQGLPARVRWLWQRLSLAAFAVPVAFFATMTWLLDAGHVTLSIPFLETMALVVLGTAVVFALLRYAACREPFFLLLAVFIAIFLTRELKWVNGHRPHGLLLLLLLLGWWRRAWVLPHLDRKVVTSLLAAAMCAYFIAVQLDEKRWTGFMPGAKLTVWSPVEEAMEVFGHLTLLVSTLVCRPMGPGGGADSVARPSEDS